MSITSTNLINYYSNIKLTSASRTTTSSKELDEALAKVSEMDDKYCAYLQTHCFVVQFFIHICWWESSVHGSYRSAKHSLAGRVAEGYENKLLTLLACKCFLKKAIYRDFCANALNTAISTIYQRTVVRGFTWKITNATGITSYLIGTIHQGTSAFANAPGVQEAINNSEKFFTEKGLICKYFKCSYSPLLTWNWRFLFVFDRYIALQAHAREKPNYILDHDSLVEETDRKIAELKEHNSSKLYPEEMPSRELLCSDRIKSESELNNYRSQVNSIALVQSICFQQRGDEKESIEFDNKTRSDDRDILCNHRTQGWLNKTYESFSSKTPMPGLIDQIRNATKPICIAVGKGHCTGNQISLMDEFQKAGFTVTRS